MPAILQQGVTMMCPHGGTVMAVPTNVRVKVGGAVALLQADVFTVVGCPFTVPPGKPQPCLTVEWQAPTVRVTIGGQAVLTQSSVGLCKSAEQIVQGTVMIIAPQPRVKGT